jgi:hypothetical protein
MADGQYTELQDLELLPLTNGQFQTFRPRASGGEVVYVCSPDDLQLFPGLHQFVSVQLPPAINHHMEQVVQQGTF